MGADVGHGCRNDDLLQIRGTLKGKIQNLGHGHAVVGSGDDDLLQVLGRAHFDTIGAVGQRIEVQTGSALVCGEATGIDNTAVGVGDDQLTVDDLHVRDAETGLTRFALDALFTLVTLVALVTLIALVTLVTLVSRDALNALDALKILVTQKISLGYVAGRENDGKAENHGCHQNERKQFFHDRDALLCGMMSSLYHLSFCL